MKKPLTPSSLLASGLLALLIACGSTEVAFTLDNPTDQPLQVSLDGKSYQIAPRTGKNLRLRPGRHTLASPVTGPQAFLVYTKSGGGLINPTLSPYVTFNMVYATNDQTAKHFSPMEQEITLDGVTFSGPFRCSRELFIDKDWAFGVHERIPDKIRVGQDRQGNIQGKVFTREDFVTEYETLTGEKGRFARERKPEPPHTFVPSSPKVPAPSGPADWDAALAPLRSVCQRYLKAESAQEQERLQKEHFQAVMTLVEFVSKTAYTLGGAENVRRGLEQQALQDCFSHSAVLLPQP